MIFYIFLHVQSKFYQNRFRKTAATIFQKLKKFSKFFKILTFHLNHHSSTMNWLTSILLTGQRKGHPHIMWALVGNFWSKGSGDMLIRSWPSSKKMPYHAFLGTQGKPIQIFLFQHQPWPPQMFVLLYHWVLGPSRNVLVPRNDQNWPKNDQKTPKNP